MPKTKSPVTRNSKTTKSKAKVGGTSKQRKRIPLFAKVLAVVLIGVVGAYAVTRSFAATGSIYLSPASSTVNANDTFTVALRVNPGTTVDAVDATITYDPNVLQFVSIDTSASVFPVALASSGGNGKVYIARGNFTPTGVLPDSLVAAVNFKAVTASSSSALSLAGNLTYAGAYTNPTVTGATVTVNNTTPPPPPGDTIAPVVTISSPANGAKASNKVSVAATATDNVKVTKMEVYIDGAIVQSSTTGSISYSWNLKSSKASKGTHPITVKAYDAAGNVGTSTVTVTN